MSTTEEMLAEVKASKPAKLAQDKHSVQHLRHVARRAMYLPDLYVLRGDRGYTEAEQLERLDKADAEVTEAASQITKQLELALEAIALAKKVVKARARLVAKQEAANVPSGHEKCDALATEARAAGFTASHHLQADGFVTLQAANESTGRKFTIAWEGNVFAHGEYVKDGGRIVKLWNASQASKYIAGELG
jgi:hypothetical protein